MTTSLGGGMGYGGSTGSASQLKGTGYRQVQTPNFTPEQMGLFQRMFSNVSPDSFTGRLAAGDQSQFEQLEAPALKQFGQLQGGLASRFSGQGGGQGPLSSRRSSGFQNTQNQAASDFAQQLQSNRLGIQQQAIQSLDEMSHRLLQQRPYEDNFFKEQKPPWQELVGVLGGGIGQGIGGFGSMYAAKKMGIY